jgi:rhomboid family GlyGly-CTERM serine protease
MHSLRLIPRMRWTVITAAIAVVATGCALSGSFIAQYLVADAGAIGDGQSWRLVSGPFVHATVGHLFWDGAILMMVGALYEERLRAVWPALLAFGTVVPTAAVFVWHPDLAGYYGLSGLTYALVFAAIAYELRRGNRDWYVIVAAVGFTAKICWQVATSGAGILPMDVAGGVPTMTAAHVVGALMGVTVVWVGAKR